MATSLLTRGCLSSIASSLDGAHRKVFVLAVTGGMVLGLTFGDRIFPQLETAFGDPLTDIILGLWGAIVAGFLHEMFAFIRNAP
jgi:hypothetical protein